MDTLNKVTSDPDNTPAKVNKSKLFIRSIGRAAQNINGLNPLLEIFPIEEFGYVDGEINTDREKLSASGIDMEGNSFNVEIDTSNVIVAEWLPLNTNRVSVPTIRRGERVIIWQYGDHDKYYWTETGFDDNLRRLETVIWRVSNTQDEEDMDITPDNSYWFEVSTHRKHITLSTSTSDGEAHAYTVQINTKDSRLVIKDDQDNFFEIDTPARKVTMCNTDNTHIVMEGKNMKIHADANIDLSCTTFNVSTTTNNFNASNYNIKATTVVNGNTSFKGSLTSNGKNISDSHTHVGVKSGPSTTGSVT